MYDHTVLNSIVRRRTMKTLREEERQVGGFGLFNDKWFH